MRRYNETPIVKDDEGKRYYVNSIYPDIPKSENDTYLITTGGDRYDTLAQQFYGDSSLWWIIASANTSKTDGLIVKPGVQLRIPGDIQDTLQLFDSVNENR